MHEQQAIHPDRAGPVRTPLRRAVGDIVRLARPYFTAGDASGLRFGRLDLSAVSERVVAWTLLSVILGINVAQVGLGVLLNQWNGRFYTALQARNLASFTTELGVFAMLAAVFICLAVYELYLTQGLVLRWRAWMTRHMVAKWMNDGVHYRLRLSGDHADNPDQRIAEDVQQFAAGTLTILVQLFSAVLSLAAFAVVLWGLSAGFSYKIGAFDLASIPGYLVWMSLMYAMAGTLITHLIGRPLVKLDADRQRREADFRFGLARLRENAEPVALLRGEAAERTDLTGRFQGVYDNTLAIMRRRKLLTFFTAGYQQVSVVVPFLLLSPAYFSSTMALGALTQTSGALGNVQGSLSVLVGLYTTLADYRAVVLRLAGFQRAVEDATSREEPMTVEPRDGTLLQIKDYLVSDKQGQPMIEIPRLDVHAGDRILIMGPSGSGKTTLLRALSGLWPHAVGRLEQSAGSRMLVLPQHPYLPWVSLRAAVSYPDTGAVQDTAIIEALQAVQLDHLIERLDEISPWQRILSIGEAQRLAFARLLLQKPDLIFLDEATSAVDEDMEARLYRTLSRTLPDAAIISIGHRSSLGVLHDSKLALELMDNGSYRLRQQRRATSEPHLAA